MQFEKALPWLALRLTKGIATCLSARQLKPLARLTLGAIIVDAPNLLINQDAKLVTNAEDVIEELRTPVRAALTRPEQPETQQSNLLAAASLTGSGQKVYATLVPTSRDRLTISWKHRLELFRRSRYAF